MKVRISACVIVKNEEKNLPRWLAQMARLADEMIVVDTGSEDRTVELAEAAGAKVYRFAWRNDFAAAKNYALDQAAGDWVFFLDADEYFEEGTEPRVRPYLEQVHLQWKIAGLISPWINIDPERQNLVVLSGHQVRIFRNEKELRYVGRIHEALDNRGKQKGMREYRMTDLVIRHTGYTVGNSERKAKRNLEILLEDVERNGGERPEQYTYFVDCYLGLRDYEKTVHYAKLAIENEGAGGQFGQLRPNYCRMFDALHCGKYPQERMMEELQECIRLHPLWPEPFWYMGRLCLVQKCYLQAEEALRRMLMLAEQQKSDPEIYLQNSEADWMLPYAYAMLGEIEALSGRRQEAVRHLTACLRAETQNSRYLQLLCRLLQSAPETERIQLLQSLCGRAQDRALLLQVLDRFPWDGVYAFFAHPADGSYEAAMARGQYREAARLAAEDLQSGMR